MSTPTVAALERIPEESESNSEYLGAAVNTLVVPVQLHAVEAEQDKYENETDPTVLRKARATAKASHTRATRAISEAFIEGSSVGELERIRAHLVRCFELVSKRHTRLLEFMVQPD